MLAPVSGSVVAPVCAAASRSSSARATRSSRRSATARFDCSGRSSRDPSAARIETRFVSVPKPEPGSATSLATRRSTRLRRSFSAARSSEPVSAANPTRTGTGRSGSRVVAPSLSRPRAIRATSASRSGVASSSRVSASPRSSLRSARVAGRKSATAAAMTSASKPARAVGVVGRAQQRGAQVGGRLDRDDRGAGREGDLDVGGDDRHPRAAVEGRLGDRGAHPAGRAVADETDRVDRLARPAGGHDDVAAGQVGVAGRFDERWAGGRIGGTDRAIADGRDDGVDDGRQLGQPPDARLARRERTGVGLDDRVAELAQPRDVGDASPGGSTCRRPSPARRRPAPTSRGSWRSRRHRPGRWPSRPASARSRARRRSRRPCRRRRCGRSGRRGAGRAARSRPGGGRVPRTRADRRSAWRTASA